MLSDSMVTVIIPCYNLEDYIVDCVVSLQRQDFSQWKCIIIDDGSVDGSLDAIRSIDDCRVSVVRQDNRGVSAARNHGLELVDTEFVMFLDGDDILHHTALTRLIYGFRQDPTAVASFGSMGKIFADGSVYPEELKPNFRRYPSGDVLLDLLKENFIANGGHILVRSSFAVVIGGFNDALRLSEDWEFWCRLALRGPFRYIGTPEPIFFLRMRTNSSSVLLSQDWNNHLPAVIAVTQNNEIRERFTDSTWQYLTKQIEAAHLWECGRVNYISRCYIRGYFLMTRSLIKYPKPKRMILLLFALIGQLRGKALISRLRFRDQD